MSIERRFLIIIETRSLRASPLTMESEDRELNIPSIRKQYEKDSASIGLGVMDKSSVVDVPICYNSITDFLFFRWQVGRCTVTSSMFCRKIRAPSKETII